MSTSVRLPLNGVSVHDLAGLAHLGLGTSDSAINHNRLARGSHLPNGQTSRGRDVVTRERLTDVVAQEVEHDLHALARLALLLGVSALALGVGRIKLRQKLGRLGGDVLGHLSVDDGLVELAVSHN